MTDRRSASCRRPVWVGVGFGYIDWAFGFGRDCELYLRFANGCVYQVRLMETLLFTALLGGGVGVVRIDSLARPRAFLFEWRPPMLQVVSSFSHFASSCLWLVYKWTEMRYQRGIRPTLLFGCQ